MEILENITIAIDGPASSGKSTVAKILAKKLGLIYIDTGAMYRTLTLQALKNDVDVNNENRLFDLLMDTHISFENENSQNNVYLNKINVTDEIRSNEVTNNVSAVSSFRSVREEMVKRQRELVQDKGAVLDGRDIGTVVLPDADVKIYLEASVEERAKRRYEENQSAGIETDYDQLVKDIETRDHMDKTREESPLKKADDAYALDTTELTIEQVVDTMVNIINKKHDS